jgi:hypothetical protein
MGILDQAKEHFSGLETQTVDVAEWGHAIFWRPWTIAERQKVWGAIKQSGREAELSARVLITKGLDKDGKNLYSLSDLRTLCHEVDSAVVERIALAIIGTEPTADDSLKN